MNAAKKPGPTPLRPANRPWKNLRHGLSAAHRRLRVDLVIFAILLFALGVTCGGGFAQGLVLGGLLMFLPRLWTDIAAVLDLEVVWDKYGAPPRRVGKHSRKSVRTPPGHHPRPRPQPDIRDQG